MTDIDLLNQMIMASAKISLEDHYGKKKITLTEPQCPDSSITITNVPDESVVIKVDAFKSPDSIFTGIHGERKRADYVIIATVEEKEYVIHIEMKKRKDDPKIIKQQLTGSRCFMSYCSEIGRAFWGQNNFLKGSLQRFISIGHISIPKRKTRFERPHGNHDSPDKLLKIDWPGKNLQFKQLVGNYQ